MDKQKKSMNHYRFLIYFATCLALFISSCKSEPTANTTVAPNVTASVNIPAFDRDSALAFVSAQVNFGPRNMGSDGHRQCKEWIISKLSQYGATVEQQDFTANVYTGAEYDATNIIARINPAQDRRILLAAHWDTRHIADKSSDPDRINEPILGADDGGSGVAVLIEIARVVSQNDIDLGIDLVFFDAEDHGSNGGASESWCLGAQYWAKNLSADQRPEYGILLDMVGASGATFPKEGESLYYARSTVDKVWQLASSMGYGHYFVETNIGKLTDDHVFVNQLAGLPMIDVINASRGFGPHWHTHQDNLAIIDRNVLRAVGQVMLAVLYKESVLAI